MPVTIKAANLKYKTADGEYIGVNSISDNTTAEQLAAIEGTGEAHLAAVNNAGTAQVTNVQHAGQEVLDSIPEDYDELVEEVNSLKSAFDNVEDAVFDVDEKTLMWVNGIVANGGSTRGATGDKTTQPVLLKSGETVTVKTKGDGLFMFNVVSSVASMDVVISETSVYCTRLVQLTSLALTEYTYTATVDTPIIISVYDDPTTEVSFSNLQKVDKVANLGNTVNSVFEIEQYNDIVGELDFSEYSGKYTAGNIGSQISFAQNNGFNLAKIEVSQKEKYKIGSAFTAGSVVWCTTDTNGIVIRKETGHSANGQLFEDNITILGTEKYLYIQSYKLRYAKKFDGMIISANNVASNLYGKLCIFNGDSICEGRLTGNSANGGAYAKLITDAVGATYINYGVSGGVLASSVPDSSNPHSVVNTLASMNANADLICFEGGINDYWKDVPLGDYTESDYTGTLDTTTICGALESIFRQATAKWVGKPIVFVIVHKIKSTVYVANSEGYTFAQARDKMIGICNKYAIPYYDAFAESGLNAYNDIQNSTFLTANSTGTPDGCHPNEAAYRRYYVPQLIALFESLMPVLDE